MADETKQPLILTPYIAVKGADAAIAFYAKVFGAREEYRFGMPDGRIGHAELLIGDGRLMLSDEFPDFGALSPHTVGGTPVNLHLYVEDVDATIKKAEAAGAIVLRPAKEEFYGDRTGMIADPFGHKWFIATRKETMAPAEMQKRYAAMMEKPS